MHVADALCYVQALPARIYLDSTHGERSIHSACMHCAQRIYVVRGIPRDATNSCRCAIVEAQLAIRAFH
eukprot:4674745-Alexandrium_andersonii.AAC.1